MTATAVPAPSARCAHHPEEFAPLTRARRGDFRRVEGALPAAGRGGCAARLRPIPGEDASLGWARR